MADQIGLSLTDYRALEQQARQLEDYQLRSATFAALRIASDRAGGAPDTELIQAFDQLFYLFGQTRLNRTIH